MSSPDLTTPFTLYYATYSVRSTIIRLLLALRGVPRPGNPEMTIHESMMDIGPFKPDQLTSFFLLTANANGTVPALTNPALLQTPLIGTVDITWYICGWYPSLLPPEHETTIRASIRELHEISFPVLTFGGDDTHAFDLNEKVLEILRGREVSEEYKKALEYKSKV